MGYPKKHRGRRKIGSRKRRAKRRAKKKLLFFDKLVQQIIKFFVFTTFLTRYHT